MAYTIHPVITGLNATDQGIMTYLRGYGQAIHIPIYVWVIKGGDKNILVDTGLEDFMVPEGLEEELGLKCEYFEDGLERLGLAPADIDVVIHTHLHNDHCENTAACENAKVYVQKTEAEFMRHPHVLDHRYDPEYLKGADLVELEGEAEIAPGVTVIPTPGHTPGGQSVLVETEKAGKVLITGFCCNDKNFPKAGPAVCPGVHTDAIAAWDAVNRVKAMAEAGEIDLIVPCHALWPGREGQIG